MQEAITVLDPVSMEPVPWDGETMGEIMFRGNLVSEGLPGRTRRRPRNQLRRRLVPHRRPGGRHPTVRQDQGPFQVTRSLPGGENRSSTRSRAALPPPGLPSMLVVANDERWGEVPASLHRTEAYLPRPRSSEHAGPPGRDEGAGQVIVGECQRRRPAIRNLPGRRRHPALAIE